MKRPQQKTLRDGRVGAPAVRRVALVLVALAVAPPADAAVVKVNCANGGNLQSKLNSAPAGSTILIKGTCHGAFTIPKRLTLKGNPTATLDADDTGPVLNVQIDKPIRLERLRIVDGSAPSGGGITAPSGEPLTLVHVTVAGNRAVYAGGGIASNGAVILLNSTVSGNVAEAHENGPTVQAGGIFAGSVRLTGSTVRNNFAHAIGDVTLTYAYGGGIVSNSSDVVVIRSHIDNNTARADGIAPYAAGGAIVTQFSTGGPIRFTRSTLNKNAALASGPAGASNVRGGAVYTTALKALRTDFIGNRAGAFAETQAGTAIGGAIDVLQGATLTRVRIRNSRLDVESNFTATANGGALSVDNLDSKLKVTNSTISGTAVSALSNTEAVGSGGGVYSHGIASISRSTIAGNEMTLLSNAGSALAVGGGIRADGVLTLQSSTVSGNFIGAQVNDSDATATGAGIALLSPTEDNKILNTTVTKNHARATAALAGSTPPVASAEGGGIAASLTAVRLTNVTVARNKVSGGGSIQFIRGGGLVSNSATFELRGTLLALNTAPDGKDCAGPFMSLGSNLFGSTQGCTFGALGPTRRTNRRSSARSAPTAGPRSRSS